MSNPWFRLYAEFASDHKIQMMPESYQRRYVMLLCLRCSNGNVTLQDEEIAFQLRISNDEWSQTKASFLVKNLIDEDNSIPAWDKRQFVSDSSAERVRRFREKKKHSETVTVTPPDTEADTDTDTEQKKEQRRGTRLNPDSAFTQEWIDFCKANRPDLDPAQVFAKFSDYWTAKPGKQGIKLDWFATWRNWVREERGGQMAKPRQPHTREDFAKIDYGTGIQDI